MSVQTTYSDGLGKPYAGMVDTLHPHHIVSRNLKVNKQAGGFNQDYIVPGRAIMIHQTAADKEASSDIYWTGVNAEPYFQGVSTLIHTHESEDNGDTRLKESKEFGVLEYGVIWMECVNAVTAGDPLIIMSNIPLAGNQNATNQEHIGKVTRDDGSQTPPIAGIDVSLPVPMRALTTRSDSGLIKVRVYPHIPINA